MEEQLDLDNLTKENFMQMAEYVAHVEAVNAKLLEELRQAKSYLSATLQQRNSAEQKYQNLLVEKTLQTVPITEAIVMNASMDLINPEQWAVPADRISVVPKSNKI